VAARWPSAPLALAGEVPFSSARKWSAVAFADASAGEAGLRHGLVALGAPTFLRPFLAAAPTARRGLAGRSRRRRPAGRAGLRVLLVAVHPTRPPCPRTTTRTRPRFRAGCALGLVALADELRAEAEATLRSFRTPASPSR
jgi:magnesium-transporting ATPase (P-type)